MKTLMEIKNINVSNIIKKKMEIKNEKFEKAVQQMDEHRNAED